MSLKELRAALRGATYRADAPEVVRLLEERAWPEQVLQLIGEALLVALTAGSASATRDLARACAARLRARGWDGDAYLAEALAARLGDGPQPLLRPVPVDLEELASVREGDPIQGGGRVDLATGQVWPQMVYEDFRADEGDDEDEEDQGASSRWLWVDPVGSRSVYRDMEVFIATLEDEHLAEVLSIAINGQGAFRRFKDALARHPEAADRWYAFSEDRVRGRARAWLTAEGYTPHPGRTPLPP